MATNLSARRQALAEIARARAAGDASGRRVRQLAGALALLILLGLIVLAVLWTTGAFGTPESVRAVRALVDEEVAALERVARNEAPFPVSADGGPQGRLAEAMRQVPEAYRGQARREMGRLAEAREAAEVDSFFGLPAEQRMAELDHRIRAEEERRQAWAAERARREQARAAQGTAGKGSGPPAAAGTPAAASGAAPAVARVGPPRGGTEESRNLRFKARIDRSTAESRARRGEYRRLKEQRRIELGLAR